MLKIKKRLMISSLVLAVIACNHLADPVTIQKEYPLEGYSPHGNVETIELANGNTVYMDEDSVFFSGDMVFPKEMIDRWNHLETKAAILSSWVFSSQYWWPTYSIPYYISSGFTTTAQNAIYNGIQMVSSVAVGLSFTQVTSAPSNGITFCPTANTNSSSVGRVSGGNTINLQSNLYYAGVVAHEIMHSLGFFHEQSRVDRDNYVTIYPNNIISGHEHNYDTYAAQNYQGFDYGNYDYSSIMHYGSYDFSINSSSPAMLKSDGSTIYKQRDSLTVSDKAGLYYLYGPRGYISEQLKYDNSDYGWDYSSENYVYSNAIAMGTTLLYPRLVVIGLTWRSSHNGGPVSTHTTYSDTVVPAGVSSYSLPDTYYHRDIDMGNEIEYEETYYEVLN